MPLIYVVISDQLNLFQLKYLLIMIPCKCMGIYLVQGVLVGLHPRKAQVEYAKVWASYCYS